MITHLKTVSETEVLKYDDCSRYTQEILDSIATVNVAHAKKQPIARIDRDPRTYKEAMNSPLAEKWYSACEDEVNSLDKIGTWEPLPWFEGAAPVGSKWVFKTKRLAN